MIYYGFDEVVYGWQRYFDLCNSFELREPIHRDDAPNIATLNKWRVESPKGFGWIVHLDGRAIDGLVAAYDRNEAVLSPEVEEAIAATEERARALAAKAIICETPAELPPSDVSRALMKLLGQRLAAESKRALLWQSSGLWTVEDGSAVAREAGLTYVTDPFMLDADGVKLERAAVAAFRLTERAAARRQFDGWEMEKLVEWASQFERTFILLSGRFKIAHAKELSLLLKTRDAS